MTKKILYKRLVLCLVLTLVVAVLTFLFWPGNTYVRRALVHRMPKIDQYPIFENREVKAGDPAPWNYTPGVDTTRIAPAFEADFEKYGTVAFVVAQHGKIKAEQYWDNYGPASRSNSFSMAKSVVSLLVGCALRDGYIQSVNQPVHDFLPEWDTFNGRPLLIKDLLTMSAGVKWDESASSLFSTTTEAYYGKDLWGLARREVMIAEPGREFIYQSGVTQILGFLLREATGKNLADYASEKIWTPIQAEETALWSLDRRDGMEKAYCCFNSNARDFARLGQLVLQNGYWFPKAAPEPVEAASPENAADARSRRLSVVDSSYIAQATTPAAYLSATLPDGTQAPCTMYGFQFWMMNYKGHDIKYFRGILGQYILVIPDMDAVVVRLGHKRASTYNPVWDYPEDIDIWLAAALEILER